MWFPQGVILHLANSGSKEPRSSGMRGRRVTDSLAASRRLRPSDEPLGRSAGFWRSGVPTISSGMWGGLAWRRGFLASEAALQSASSWPVSATVRQAIAEARLSA